MPETTEVIMNNEYSEILKILPNMLTDSSSELETQIRKLNNSSPTVTNYEEVLYITNKVITIAIHMTETLEKIAEDANVEAPDGVIGAAGKVNLGYSPKEKNEVARIALESARAVLNNYNRLVSPSVAEIADVCHNIIKD